MARRLIWVPSRAMEGKMARHYLRYLLVLVGLVWSPTSLVETETGMWLLTPVPEPTLHGVAK